VTCPTCARPLAAAATYGPCEDCRAGMRQRAEDRAANRRVPEPAPEPAPVERRPPPPPEPYSGPVGHCVWCTKPVYGEHAERGESHPCCDFWMGEVGMARCFACQPIAPARVPARPQPTATPARPGAAA
jgi:hypothetical protein